MNLVAREETRCLQISEIIFLHKSLGAFSGNADLSKTNINIWKSQDGFFKDLTLKQKGTKTT